MKERVKSLNFHRESGEVRTDKVWAFEDGSGAVLPKASRFYRELPLQGKSVLALCEACVVRRM